MASFKFGTGFYIVSEVGCRQLILTCVSLNYLAFLSILSKCVVQNVVMHAYTHAMLKIFH